MASPVRLRASEADPTKPPRERKHRYMPFGDNRLGEVFMAELKINGIRARIDASDNVALNAEDLNASQADNAASLREIALFDRSGINNGIYATGNEDGWVSAAEVYSAQNVTARTYHEYKTLACQAKHDYFTGLDAANPWTGPAPQPLGPRTRDLSALPRDAYVPLARYLSHLFKTASQPYASQRGQPSPSSEPPLILDATALLARYDMHEIAAACAIQTARFGLELCLSRDKLGQYRLVRGVPESLELDEALTGLDHQFHTHPAPGESAAQPSRGDFYATQVFDPDHQGAAVSEDGFWVSFRLNDQGGFDVLPAKRLWR
jgi:hypothetical protein